MSEETRPRLVVLAGGEGTAARGGAEPLRRAGYRVVLASEPDELAGYGEDGAPDLVVVDETFGPDGGIMACRRLRADPVFRKCSLMVVVPAGAQHLEECVVSGINDFMVAPYPEAELLDKARRLTLVPARREMNTMVRIREVRQGGASFLGKTLNVSANGLLLEVDGALGIGRLVDLEFFLPEDPTSVRSRGQVTRRAHEVDAYHPAFGVRFLELGARDRSRISQFVGQRGAAAPGSPAGRGPAS